MQEAIHAAAQDAGHAALGVAHAAYSPVAIKEGWGLVVSSGGPETAVQVTQSSALFPVVEYPTRPHVILGHGGPLAWQQGGTTHFAWRVQHPGTPGKGRVPGLLAFLTRTFDQAVTARLAALLGAG